MKAKFTSLLLVLCVMTLCACGGELPEDHVAPVLNGLDTVRIDRETETFNVLDGVTAIDKDDQGNESNLSDSIKVIAPAGVNVNDGIAEFRQAGDYIFTYYVKDDKGNDAVVNRKVEVRNIYNCYWMSATLPVLYCALDMVANDYKSMLVFTRKDTLNIDEMDDERFILKVNGAGQEDLHEAWRMVGRIAYEDEYSYFRVFLTDIYSQSEMFSFMRYKIPASRYEVKLVSDGSATYGGVGFPYRADGSYTRWAGDFKFYNNVIDKALKGEFGTDPETGLATITHDSYVVTSGYTEWPLNRMGIMAAQRDNVEMWCAYPETLRSDDALVQAEIDKAHMPKMAPNVMYDRLTDVQKQKFLKLCNFDKETFDKEYFDKDGEYLIITGTNPFTSNNFTDAEFADLLEKIIADYDGYNILYKPHPSAVEPGDDLPLVKSVLQNNDVKILPGRLPMEVITWVYGDAKIGGFDSSLFMSVPQGNTCFFIAPNANSLSQVSKWLYDEGSFGQPTFYWKV